MATTIQDHAELQYLADLCENNGIYLPGDIKTVEELVRYLLIGHKTKVATLALQRERANRARLANRDNPDLPRDDDGGERQAKRRIATQFSARGVMQFGTEVPGTYVTLMHTEPGYIDLRRIVLTRFSGGIEFVETYKGDVIRAQVMPDVEAGNYMIRRRVAELVSQGWRKTDSSAQFSTATAMMAIPQQPRGRNC